MKTSYLFCLTGLLFTLGAANMPAHAQLAPSGTSYIPFPIAPSVFSVGSNTYASGTYAGTFYSLGVTCSSGCGLHKWGDQYADDWAGGNHSACGWNIYSPFCGTVITAGWCNSYGYNVVIRSTANSGFAFRVAHLSSVTVSVGQSVDRNTRIGVLGTTGNSTGCHAHTVLYRNVNSTIDANFRANTCYQPGYGSSTFYAAPFFFKNGSGSCGVRLNTQGGETPVDIDELDEPLFSEGAHATGDIKPGKGGGKCDGPVGQAATTATEEKAANAIPLEVYPNPVETGYNTNFRFTLEKAAYVQLTVMDQAGRTVRSVINGILPAGVQNKSMQVNDLPRGIYLYRLLVDNAISSSGKIVVQ
jgi:Peptidase family M23/Secretion system C-terminal sorting domain